MPFEIPETWEWCRLGSIASILGGKRIPAGRKLTTENTGHIYIRVSDMKNNSVIMDNLLYVPQDIYDSISKYIIESNDVYITVAGTIGAVGKIPLELNGANLTENADRIVFKGLNQNWLIYFLQTNLIQGQIIDATTKVGQPKLAITRIENLLIPLPPVNEQERIVSKIEELLPYITEYEKTEKNLTALNKAFPDQLKKSILQQAVQGKLVPQDPNDETASVLLEHIRAEKQELIKTKKIKKDKNESIIYKRDNSHYELCNGVERCIDDEIPFEIPESWCWARCSSLGSIIRGSGIKRTETIEKGSPCIRYGEIYTSYDLAFSDTISFIPQDLFDQCKHISKNDVIFTLTGENKPDIAKAIVYLGDEPIAAGGDLAYWTCHGMNPMYLVLFLSCPYAINRKVALATGDIIVHISGEKIGSILIPVPPLNEQHRIVNQVENITSIIEEI